MAGKFMLRADAPMSAVPPPPGVTSNFDDPPVTAQAAYTLVAVGVAIAGALLILRIYTKGIILRKFGWEDGVCTVNVIGKGSLLNSDL